MFPYSNTESLNHDISNLYTLLYRMSIKDFIELDLRVLDDIIATSKRMNSSVELMNRWLRGIQKIALALKTEGN